MRGREAAAKPVVLRCISDRFNSSKK